MNSILRVGFEHCTGKSDEKSVYLINLITVIHLFAILISITIGLFIVERLIFPISLWGYLFFILVNIVILFFQHLGKFTVSKYLLTFLSLGNTYLFDHYILPDFNIKYYYIISALMSLFLFHRSWVSHFIFLVSVVLFYNFFNQVDQKTIHIINFYLVLYLITFFLVRINKKSEESLQEKNSELQRIQEFKNKFFVQVAHEIKTPVTILFGNVQLLYERIKAPTIAQVEEFNEIKRQKKKLFRITNDVLDLERMQEYPFAVNKSRIDLVELVTKTVASFQSNFEDKQIQFDVSLTVNYAFINGSKIHLERVINNVLSNAIKFSSRGSVVHVSLRIVNDCYSIDIKDEGIGIPEEDLERVFEHFYQSNNHITASSGTGIGLAFCKEVINIHDGTIKIIPNLNKGITVSINLPIDYLLAIDNKESQEVVNDELTDYKGKILLVDDNKEIRFYLQKILKGYEVVEAENGKIALETMSRDSFDLVVTDYMMPEMNGLELLKEIKSRKIDSSVIILTARTSTESRLSALRLGVDDYLFKPFEQEELLLRVNYLIQNRSNRTLVEISEQEESNTIKNVFLNQVQLVLEEVKSLNNFKITDLADLLNVSPSTLLRNIKSYTGLTAKQYLKEIGLQRARQLFEVDKLTNIKTLMNEAGMKNQTYFSREFKERFGIDLKRKKDIKI